MRQIKKNKKIHEYNRVLKYRYRKLNIKKSNYTIKVKCNRSSWYKTSSHKYYIMSRRSVSIV